MRPSNNIRDRQTREIRRAGRYARLIEKDLTRWVVTDFGKMVVGDEGLQAKQHRLIRRKALSWWAHKRSKGLVSGSFVDLLTWENPNGRIHSNWLVHIPINLVDEFRLKLENWHKKVLPNYQNDTLDEQEIWNLNGLLSYILKGANPDYAKATDIRPVPQGTIWGRRAFAAMALGKTARKRSVVENGLVQPKIKGLPLPKEARELQGLRWNGVRA